MDNDEVEVWYEEEKQKLMDEYLKELNEGKNPKDAEKIFTLKLNQTVNRYNELIKKNIERKKRKERFKKQVDKFKEKIRYLREKFFFFKKNDMQS
jgi:hypothetical protein